MGYTECVICWRKLKPNSKKNTCSKRCHNKKNALASWNCRHKKIDPKWLTRGTISYTQEVDI